MIAPAAAADDRDAWRHHMTRIVAIHDEAEGVRTYDLAFRAAATAAAYTFAPGQFNMLYLPGIGEVAISISSAPHDRTCVRHTVKAVGNVTQALTRLRPGDEVVLRGPFGTPWPLDDLRGRDLLIVTGGVGLASVRAAILHVVAARSDYGRVFVLCGAKRPTAVVYAGEYADWQAAGIEVHTTVDEEIAGWAGRVGLVTGLFDDLPLDPDSTSLICCGPEAMMLAAVKRARAAGIPSRAMYLSMERNMSCAARLCGLCQFGPEFVCHDGPVFPYDRIARFLTIPNL